MATKIRKCQPGEEQVRYDICLLTGDSGVDATTLYQDPRLLGEVYVGPCLRFAAALALVGQLLPKLANGTRASMGEASRRASGWADAADRPRRVGGP